MSSLVPQATHPNWSSINPASMHGVTGLLTFFFLCAGAGDSSIPNGTGEGPENNILLLGESPELNGTGDCPRQIPSMPTQSGSSWHHAPVLAISSSSSTHSSSSSACCRLNRPNAPATPSSCVCHTAPTDSHNRSSTATADFRKASLGDVD